MPLKAAFLPLLTVALSCSQLALTAEPPSPNRLLIWLASTNANFDANGNEVSGNTTGLTYSRQGDLVQAVSTAFVSPKFFGFSWASYDTNIFISTNGGSSSLV